MSARGTPGRSACELSVALEKLYDPVAIQSLRPGVPRAVRFPVALNNTPPKTQASTCGD
jgi:hypothetical protein